jgi:RNA polymerase sigma-70 factor (ECF subfamily)
MEPMIARRPTTAIAPSAESEPDLVGALDRATTVFLSARPRLFGIAHRILHDQVEAEDVVQNAWLRWQTTDRTVVVNPEAFLVTATTRLAINDVQSARHRRELPAGPWLLHAPDDASGPEADAEQVEAVADAVFTLLAKLSPAERATYLLREAFDYPYDRIADLLHLRPANCRQLVRRARDRITAERSRPVSVAAHRQLLNAFVAAARRGDFTELERLLARATAHRKEWST